MSKAQYAFAVMIAAAAISIGFLFGGPLWGCIFATIAIAACVIWLRARREEATAGEPVESLFKGNIPAPPTTTTGKRVGIPAAAFREHAALSQQLLFQRLAAEERKSIGRADWLQLAKDFESCPQQLRAEYSRHGLPGQDSWYIGGWTPSDKCKSLCRMAGTMLISSRQVRYALSEEVRPVSDPIYRWLYFLKERRHLDNYLFAVETFPDGQTAGVYSGYINNLPEASAAACIDCAAKET